MGLRIVIVGVAGVGKSTVVQKAVESIDGSGVMVFGTEMFEAAKKLGWVKHRDEMRKLRVEKQRRLQKIAADAISRTKGKKVIFVDTHLFVRTPEGFWPGLPLAVIQSLKPTHLLLIEADPQEVLQEASQRQDPLPGHGHRGRGASGADARQDVPLRCVSRERRSHHVHPQRGGQS